MRERQPEREEGRYPEHDFREPLHIRVWVIDVNESGDDCDEERDYDCNGDHYLPSYFGFGLSPMPPIAAWLVLE